MSQGRIHFESFDLNLDTGELHKEGSRIPLQDQPLRLLALLARRRGDLVTREEIKQELWKDGEFVEYEHSINTAILRIRRALDDNSETPRIIQTYPKRGYRFIATVTMVEPESQTSLPPQVPNPPVKPPPVASDDYLPISVGACRVLFLLAQVPYVASYIAAFTNWDNMDEPLKRAFGFIPVDVSLRIVLVVALIGFAVRIYLIGLVGWKHKDAGPRYRRLFPYLLPLDAIWAATPLLVQDKASALVAWAGIILMSWLIFGQRTLMRSIEGSGRGSGAQPTAAS